MRRPAGAGVRAGGAWERPSNPSVAARSRILVLNDEAHHCYLPRQDNRIAEGEDTDEENQRAAVWFSGLREVARRHKLAAVYDLSATPHYLTGSGCEPYSLFPWTVSDFGLIESIESGLVKIPFLPTSDDASAVAAAKIAAFKRDYARIHGSGAAERLSEVEILREVVNTVGKPNALGSHVRCVVSVSMLTEGWDANTVSHIMGLRAFGSQLLCEQVAGRALRRRRYFLQGYNKQGQPTSSTRFVSGHTAKEVRPTRHSHVNVVILDSGWEGKAAEALDKLVEQGHNTAIPMRSA